MSNLIILGEVAVEPGMKEFVDAIIAGISGQITLTTVATVVAAIIGAGIISVFAWKFARKGYRFVTNALSGKNGKF